MWNIRKFFQFIRDMSSDWLELVQRYMRNRTKFCLLRSSCKSPKYLTLRQNFDASVRQNVKCLKSCNIFTYVFAECKILTLRHVTLLYVRAENGRNRMS